MNKKIIVSLFMLCVATTSSFVVSRLPMFVPLASSHTSSLTLMAKAKKELSGTDLKELSIQKIMNTNISIVIHYTECDQINITSVYVNIDKVKGVYFAKDVKNVIFTLPYDLSDLYYYDKDGEVIYKVSNKTRINMKGLSRFVFQSFNNNIDGIMF